MADPLEWSAWGIVCGPMARAQLMAVIRQDDVGYQPSGVRQIVASRDSVTTGLVFAAGLAVLTHRLAGALPMVASAWLVTVGGQLMLIDWVFHRLPNHLVVALFLGGMVIFSTAAVHGGNVTAFVRAVLAATVVFAAALMTALIFPGSLGAGDVKLLGAVALFLGWAGWLQVLHGIALALLLGAAAGAVLLATKRISRDDRLAFGPAILGGALLTIVTL
ncbi:A24 family peptidase [Actinosynnema sp. NPDC050436]|uniref:A24 family peptidase n=1 Tax=Actinosynnema sp. NPDC050436 TaxID=3155659 RepID=UPI0033D6C9A4